MENKEKNEPCYAQNAEAKFIETSIQLGDLKIEVKQRRLTGLEKQNYANELKNVYTDKDVYMGMLANENIKTQLEKAKKKNKKAEIIVDDETKYLIYKGRVAIDSQNRNTEAFFIANSCNDSLSRGGYFKVDGKDVDFETKLQLIKELDEDDLTGVDNFKLLLANANKLTYPTPLEDIQAKQ